MKKSLLILPLCIMLTATFTWALPVYIYDAVPWVGNTIYATGYDTDSELILQRTAIGNAAGNGSFYWHGISVSVNGDVLTNQEPTFFVPPWDEVFHDIEMDVSVADLAAKLGYTPSQINMRTAVGTGNWGNQFEFDSQTVSFLRMQ